MVETPSSTRTSQFHVSKRLLIEPIDDQRSIIFNPLSGAIDFAGPADVAAIRMLQEDTVDELSNLDLKHLMERGFLFRSALEEEKFLERRVAEAQAKMATQLPTTYVACPTLACNLACSYCFEGDSLTDKRQGVMTPEQVKLMMAGIKAMRTVDDAEGAPAPWLSLFGGEPLLPSTRAAVAQIFELAANDGMLLSGTTNGVNICLFGDLLAQYADVIMLFQVTLDGPKAVHDARRHRLGGQGTFDAIVRGIDLLLELGIGVDLRINTDAENIDSIPDLCRFVKAKGWADSDLLRTIIAPIAVHSSQGCSSKYEGALSELDFEQRVLDLIEREPIVGEVSSPAHLRHLEYLVSILEPERLLARPLHGDSRPGPRFWYCEAGTGKHFMFAPDGLVYSCTESVGKPDHAIGRFDPEFVLWEQESRQWLGRTILSHAQCRSCSISTLCGGGCHFAARDRAMSAGNNGHQLIQIGLPKSKPQPSAMDNVDPFCAGAQQIVRQYLHQAGNRMIAKGAF